MEHILLIDTSADKCTVGLAQDGLLTQAIQHAEKQSQAAVLNLMVEQLCKDNQIELSSLGAIAVCSGPGSYTGLRIGMAAAKGFALALGKSLILHDKLELLAYQQMKADNSFWHYAPIITARENEFFYACYDADMNIIQHAVHGDHETIQALIQQLPTTSLCLIGDAHAQEVFGEKVQAMTELNFSFWAAWANESFAMANFSDIAAAVPFYMKEVFIHAPKRKD